MKTLLIFSKNDIMLQGITRLLGAADGIAIVRAHSYGQQEVADQILDATPDTVIVDTSLLAAGLMEVKWLFHCADNLRILAVGTNSNEVEVYVKKTVQLDHPGDLLAIL